MGFMMKLRDMGARLRRFIRHTEDLQKSRAENIYRVRDWNKQHREPGSGALRAKVSQKKRRQRARAVAR